MLAFWQVLGELAPCLLPATAATVCTLRFCSPDTCAGAAMSLARLLVLTHVGHRTFKMTDKWADVYPQQLLWTKDPTELERRFDYDPTYRAVLADKKVEDLKLQIMDLEDKLAAAAADAKASLQARLEDAREKLAVQDKLRFHHWPIDDMECAPRPARAVAPLAGPLAFLLSNPCMLCSLQVPSRAPGRLEPARAPKFPLSA